MSHDGRAASLNLLGCCAVCPGTGCFWRLFSRNNEPEVCCLVQRLHPFSSIATSFRICPEPMKPYTLLTQLKRQIRNRLRRLYGALSSYLRTQMTRRYRGLNNRRRLTHSDRPSQTFGFVLPTAIMLLLVMSLVVGGILIRTFNRTQQAITQREAVEIYNDATPAVDRAKAKLEYLFQKDPRLPAGIPAESLQNRCSTKQNAFA